MSIIFNKLNLKSQTEILALNAPESFEPEMAALNNVTIRRNAADAVILRLCQEDVGCEGLRIAVAKREPVRLNLSHYAVARQEDVVRRGQRKAIEQKKRDKTPSKSSRMKL